MSRPEPEPRSRGFSLFRLSADATRSSRPGSQPQLAIPLLTGTRIRWLKPNREKPRERGLSPLRLAKPAVNGGPTTAPAESPVNGANNPAYDRIQWVAGGKSLYASGMDEQRRRKTPTPVTPPTE